MKNKYYSLESEGKSASLNIFGDISEWAEKGSGRSVSDLTKQLADLEDVEHIEVTINSYGGEVAQGLAIYNALRNHKARITMRCSGFACSIASVIFMAGEERIMDDASLLMIHNAWTFAEGNAADLRKQAEDLDKITEASVKAYMSRVNISEEKLRALMDAETWLDPEAALEYGFATSIEKHEADNPSQNARKKVQKMILNPYQALDEEDKKDDPKCAFPDDEEDDMEDPETSDDMEEPETTDEPDDMDDGTDDMDDPDDEEEPKAEFPDDEDPEKDPEEEPKEKTCGDDERKKQCAFFRAVAKL